MVDLQGTRAPAENPQFRFILVPDYSEQESALILRSHHSVMDGQGFAALFALLCGEKDGSKLPAFPV